MTAINVRLTEKEKSILKKYGKISDLVRDAIKMYVNDKKSMEAIKKLKEYQKKNKVTTSTEEIVAMIREDRDNH